MWGWVYDRAMVGAANGSGGDDGGGGGVRLHKFLAHAGVASRRGCEELIAAGKVRVNGRVVEHSPVWVEPGVDEVWVNGEVVAGEERHVYVMLYKPRKTVSTMSDEAGRRTVSDLVRHPSGARLYPVGRLDYETLGLVVMTNDGALADRMTHPRYGLHKTYRAVVRGRVEDEDAERLERGIYLAQRKAGRTVGGERLGMAKIEVVRRERDRSLVDITLQEGRNRQIRRLLAAVDFPVRKLTRIRMGPLALKGLRMGEWRELTKVELGMLRKAARAGEAAARARAGEGAGGGA